MNEANLRVILGKAEAYLKANPASRHIAFKVLVGGADIGGFVVSEVEMLALVKVGFGCMYFEDQNGHIRYWPLQAIINIDFVPKPVVMQ